MCAAFTERAGRNKAVGDRVVKRAFVFPGQGSQEVGMGRALAEQFPAARQVLEEVDDALGEHLSRLMAEGPGEDLMLTRNFFWAF